MSRELRKIEISFTVHKPENLPADNGKQWYADDVTRDLRLALQRAVDDWYASRGRFMVTDLPEVV